MPVPDPGMKIDPENTAVVITDPQNPAPDFYDKDRPCKNIYTDAIVMLDVHTSKLAWYYQVIPHDVHDYDLTHVAPVFTTTVDGQQRTVIALTGKDGLLRLLDRGCGCWTATRTGCSTASRSPRVRMRRGSSVPRSRACARALWAVTSGTVPPTARG